MLRYILFDTNFFESEKDRASSQKRVLILLNALTWCNQLYLREHPETPLIYSSNIEYKVPAQFEREYLPEVEKVRAWLLKKGAPDEIAAAFKDMADQLGAGEHFREIPRIIENGGGDCDNLAAWRAAELRERGIMARPFITWRQRADGGTTYHVCVLWPDGTHEDPSLLCGMGGAAREADRAEEERKLAERTADYISGLIDRRKRELVSGVVQTPSDFGKGPQYSPTFWTDDAYEDWSPTRPQVFYANPFYKGGNIQQQGPLFNALWRGGGDEDWDYEDRFDGNETTARWQARHPEAARLLWRGLIAPGNAIRRKLRQIRARRAG